MSQPTILQPVICLMGPTAAGKTNIAMQLAKQWPVDIISVDSAMVYRDMNIGTAKPSIDELALAPHRLIDIRDPANSYSAADFCHDAQHEIMNSLAAQRLPLLVGGTMLYFNALQQGLSPLPEANDGLRQALTQQAEQLGWPAMHEKLQVIDPQAAKRIHPNDPQRIQRALEVHQLTGQNITTLQQQRPEKLPYQFINIAIAPHERQVLHQRIEKRFDAMLADGFIDEVDMLYQRDDLHIDLPAMRCVGYRQVWNYLAGHSNKSEMRELSVIATRQLAKRQLTWLRAWDDVKWLNSENSTKIKQSVIDISKILANIV